MVFLGGPRQVGKTTLVLQFLKGVNPAWKHPAYLSYDDLTIRDVFLKAQLPTNQPILILDEIHKFKNWRQLLKGFYDTNKHLVKLLVTGSARLDYYRKGGDSLVGRYHYYRLHPYSLNEKNCPPLADLIRLGGFPEPLFSGSERGYKRWSKERTERVVYQDLRDLEMVKDLSMIDLLLIALPQRVGSPLSIKAISEDLQVAFETADRWISLLERVYMVYRISPYGAPKIRAVKKEQKLYFWDWAQIENQGARFENLVASHLLKYCHFIEDTEGEKMELRFLRDIDKREIDFVVLKNGKPQFAVEAKSGEKELAKSISYFRERTTIPAFYQVHLGTKDYGNPKNGRALPFTTFCKEIIQKSA